MLRIGEQIPELELDALLENEIDRLRLSDFRGKWLVLIFYPEDFSFVCPTELEEAAEAHQQFRDLGAEIVSVSTDSAFSHKAWHDASRAVNKVKFPMLADPAGKLCRAMGTYIEDKGISLRATFIVDPNGVVKFFEMNDNAIGRSITETLRKLQAIKHVHEHPDSLCPASWRPGSKAIKPKFDLIGSS